MSTLGWNSDLDTQDSDLLVRRQLTLDKYLEIHLFKLLINGNGVRRPTLNRLDLI